MASWTSKCSSTAHGLAGIHLGRFCSWSAAQNNGINVLDPVIRALPAYSHLRKVTIMTQYASADAVKNLLHSPKTLHLVLHTEPVLAVAQEIQHGRNDIEVPILAILEGTSSEATKAVKAIARAIRRDRIMKRLDLEVQNGFTDEAGVALAKALPVNKTLCEIKLTDNARISDQARNKATLGVQAYEAFSAMLRVNTSLLTFELPPLDTAGGDQRVRESHDQMCIEQRLNKAGRGELLSSSRTTREAWVDALQKLNVTSGDDTPAFHASCLYSLLRLKPPAWMLPPSDTSNSGE
jgi:hypothetical protein